MPTGEQGGRDPQRVSSANFWLRAALVIVVVGILLAWGWMSARPMEPSYQGKPLREWLKISVDPDRDREAWAEAEAAIRKIGTNGIPTLLRMIQASDSEFRIKLQELAEKQSFIKFKFLVSLDIRAEAYSGFLVLGGDAKGAVPELVVIAKKPSGTAGRQDAIVALGHIGPSAQAAVPALLAIASDAKDQNRDDAIRSLGLIRSSTESVLPFLESCLRDPDVDTRCRAAGAFYRFGEAAKSSVPALIPLLTDSSEAVRIAAMAALKRIDPAAATKAGIP